MKKFLSVFSIILFVALIVQSCSEDSSSPKDDDSNNINLYFPYTEGSLAIYKAFDLDSSGNAIEETAYQYKEIVKPKQTINSKEAYVFEHQSMDGDKVGEYYFYSNKTQVFQFIRPVPEMDFDLPLDIPEDWYKIYDENQSKWDIYSYYFDNEEIDAGGFNVILTDTFKIFVTFDGTENVTWGDNMDKTDEAKVFTFNYQYLGKATIKGIPIPIQIPFTGKFHMYYVKNIGIVKTKFDNLYITLSDITYQIAEGFEHILMSIEHPVTLY